MRANVRTNVVPLTILACKSRPVTPVALIVVTSPSKALIELGEAANQMVEIFVRVSPELRSHLKDLVVLNMNKIGDLQ